MRVTAIVIVAVLVLAGLAAPVAAYDEYWTGPRDLELEVNVTADENASYTSTINASDPDTAEVLNYNASVLPFLDATNIRGTFTGSWLPPSLWAVGNGTAMLVELFGITQFRSSWVMSGSSYSWWRLPLEDPNTTAIELQVWHVDNPELVNWTASRSSPTGLAHPQLVFDGLYNAKSSSHLNKTIYWWNATAWNYSHHWVWVKVVAPLHSDEAYAYKWSLGPVSAVRPYYSLGDVGDDGLFRSWIYASSGTPMQLCEADLDCSVVHQYGMGDAVSGFNVNASSSINFYTELSEPVQNLEYVTFMMPLMRDITNASNARVQLRNVNGTWSQSWWVAASGPSDFTVRSFQWNHAYTNSLFFVNVTFQNSSNWIFINDPNSEFDLDFDDDSAYATNRFVVYDHPDYPQARKFFFRPYHALQVADGQWVNTDIPPVYVLDGHVVNWSLRPQLDRSPRTPWYIRVAGGVMEIPLYVYWGLDWLLFDILPDISRSQYWQALDRVAEWLKDKVWTPLCHVGAWLWKVVSWAAENWSWVTAGILMGINMVVFLPVWGFTVLTLNGIKRFFIVLVKDGPAAAGAYADEFFRNSIRHLRATPAGIIAGGAAAKVRAGAGGV